MIANKESGSWEGSPHSDHEWTYQAIIVHHITIGQNPKRIPILPIKDGKQIHQYKILQGVNNSHDQC